MFFFRVNGSFHLVELFNFFDCILPVALVFAIAFTENLFLNQLFHQTGSIIFCFIFFSFFPEDYQILIFQSSSKKLGLGSFLLSGERFCFFLMSNDSSVNQTLYLFSRTDFSKKLRIVLQTSSTIEAPLSVYLE